jgi:hypothetical protein
MSDSMIDALQIHPLVPTQGLRCLFFDDDAKIVFLDHYARFNRKKMAAMAAGVSVFTVHEHIKKDPEFALAVEEAKEAYKDRVKETMYKAGVEGIEETIFGGQFKNEPVGTKRTFYPLLTLAEAKRVEPEYRDKQSLDVTHRGGVLLIPAEMTPQEWEAKYGKQAQDLSVPVKALPAPNTG